MDEKSPSFDSIESCSQPGRHSRGRFDESGVGQELAIPDKEACPSRQAPIAFSISASDQSIVPVMRSDPEPDEPFITLFRECPDSKTDSDGPERSDLFES